MASVFAPHFTGSQFLFLLFFFSKVILSPRRLRLHSQHKSWKDFKPRRPPPPPPPPSSAGSLDSRALESVSLGSRPVTPLSPWSRASSSSGHPSGRAVTASRATRDASGWDTQSLPSTVNGSSRPPSRGALSNWSSAASNSSVLTSGGGSTNGGARRASSAASGLGRNRAASSRAGNHHRVGGGLGRSRSSPLPDEDDHSALLHSLMQVATEKQDSLAVRLKAITTTSARATFSFWGSLLA